MSETFHLARYAEGTTETVIVENDGPAPNFSQPEKGALVAVRFTIGAALNPAGMTNDFLEGFLLGYTPAPGLVLRDCRVEMG